MCGIVGTVNQPLRDEAVACLAHRGPDDHGRMAAEVGPSRVELGHTRLSIVDLTAAGHQPMRSRDGRCWISFNGEIYNHLELRRTLVGPFHGSSDTETILELFAARGISALPSLNGIFAFAFLDTYARKLYLARDPFGVKPLYYNVAGQTLAFASELRPLLDIVGAQLDVTRLAELLRLRYLPSPDTLFCNIQKVRPGHLLEIDLSNENVTIAEHSYAAAPPPPVRISFADAAAEYDRLLRAAVHRQLMSDVPVGVLLSGGIDSAMIAAYAREAVSYPLQAFTVGFEGDEYEEDEIAAAAETARILGLQHHWTRIRFGDFMQSVRRCVEVVEEPLATSSMIPMDYLSDLAARHVKVVLSGQGADETLGGYSRYRAELLHARLPRPLRALAAAVVEKAGGGREMAMRGARMLRENEEIARFIAAHNVFTPEEIHELIGVDDHLSAERLRYSYDLLALVDQPRTVRLMMLDLRTALSDDLLLYTDKVTMHHSLECRVPMLDLELVSFLESLPVAHRTSLRRSKIVHKHVAAQRLPARIINRKKLGFLSPTRQWFRDGGMLRAELLEPNSSFLSMFDRTAVERLIVQHTSGVNKERQLFLLLAIRAWMDAFLTTAPPPICDATFAI